MLVGIAEAGFLPGILVYLTWWFPAYHRARANALFMIAMPVTMMLGSILSGYILAMDGLWNLKGWQWLFLLEGCRRWCSAWSPGSSSTTRRIRPPGWITTRNRR
jgi:MFS family permease